MSPPSRTRSAHGMPTRSRSSSGGSEGGRRGRLWEAEPPTRTSSSRTAAAAAHGHQQRWEETTAKPLRRRRRSSGTVPAQLEPHAQQQPSSVAASAASAPQVFETAHAFRIGELVERRDSGEDWKEGYVTSLVPLEVTVNADPRADGYSWDEVRPRGARDLPPPQRPTSEPARSSIAADAAAARALPTEHLLSSDSSHSVEEAPSTSPAKGKRRGSLVATDRWALASKELHGKARRELSGIASEQAARTLADERAIIFSVTVYHLGEVNLVQQSFFADVGIHMSWMEPDLKDLERTSDVTDLSPSDPRVHIPTFFIENRLEVKSITDAIVTMRRKDPKGVVRWEQRFAGTFMELLDLRYFPFDVQTLSIELRVNSKYDDARERYAVSLEKGNASIKKRVHLQEWHIHAPVARASSDEKGKPTYNLHMVLRRKAGHFKNIMVLMGLMATVALGTFALEPSDFASRSQVVLSLLLNAVAYKFAVAAELPHVPYSTTFDEYMDASVKFLLLLFIENALVGWPTRYLEGAAGAQTFVDHVLSVAIACGWGMYNVRFYSRVWRYNASLDELLDAEINVDAGDDLQVVAATKLQM